MRKLMSFILYIGLMLFLCSPSSFAQRESFTRLRDAPQSYKDQAGKCVTVKDNETGLEFEDCGAGGGATITQTITDGDTTNAPSGDAINDALAGKMSTSLQISTPQTYNYTESGNITGITSTWVNLNDTGAAGAKQLDVQNATVNGKYIYYAASGQSTANPLTINMGDTTCTNCPAGGFILTEPGQRVELYWNTSIYTVLWPITSIDIAVPVPNIADPDNWTLTTNFGHYTGNAAGAVSLVAPSIYDSILLDTEGTGAMTINPAGTDHIWLDGTDCGESVGIVSSGTTGDTVAIKYRTSTTLSAKSNGFSCVVP